MSSFEPIVPRNIPRKKVICGFTTRAGGISPEPFDSLNCGFSTPDNRSNVLHNRSIVYRYANVDEENVALMGQVHDCSVKVAHSGGVFEETDALLTARTGLMLGVLVADCIPLLVYDPYHDVIGAVHCGWRPIVKGIVEKSLRMMTEQFSTNPGALITALGPSVGPCCYEIGEDVACRLKASSIRRRSGRLYGDLQVELNDRLVSAGVQKRHIELFGDCTICNESLYFSFRRDGKKSGRMLGFIMLKGKS